MGEQHGSDRPLSEDEVVERIEQAGAQQPHDPPLPPDEQRRHDQGDPTEQPRETAARASGRGEDPEGHPVDGENRPA
jgi:hypothetical protein